jgi:hypothetical protein
METQMIDLLLTNGDLFTMAGDGAGYIESGAAAFGVRSRARRKPEGRPRSKEKP